MLDIPVKQHVYLPHTLHGICLFILIRQQPLEKNHDDQLQIFFSPHHLIQPTSLLLCPRPHSVNQPNLAPSLPLSVSRPGSSLLYFQNSPGESSPSPTHLPPQRRGRGSTRTVYSHRRSSTTIPRITSEAITFQQGPPMVSSI